MRQRRARIREMLDQGLRVSEIARKLRLPYSQVYSTIENTPDLRVNRPAPTDPGQIARQHGTRIGHIGPALGGQSPDFLTWLAENTPEGTTISEFLVAVAIDQFQYEIEAREAA